MTEIEKAVHKATSSKHTAPKRKHVRTIIIECWNENSSRSFFTEVSKRPLEGDIVCFKALNTTHKVIQEGPRQGLVDSYYRIQWVDSIRDHWNRAADKGYSHLNGEYARFLHDKIIFHHKHTEFEGDLSLEKFLKAHKPDLFELDKCIEMVSQLLDFQESVFKLEHSITGPGNITDLKAAGIIPLVLESYAIYTVVTYFLQKMVDRVDDMDVLQFLIERYYMQYLTLREFYINAAAVRAVSSVIAVPNLPADPPRFVKKKQQEVKPRLRKGNTPIVTRREIAPPPQLHALALEAPPPLTQAQYMPPQPQLALPVPQYADPHTLMDTNTPPPSHHHTHTHPHPQHGVPQNVPALTQFNMMPAQTSIAPMQYQPPPQPIVHQPPPQPLVAQNTWDAYNPGPPPSVPTLTQPVSMMPAHTSIAPMMYTPAPAPAPAPTGQSQWVTFQNSPDPTRRSDPFSNLLSMAKTEQKPDPLAARPRAQTQPEQLAKMVEVEEPQPQKIVVTNPPGPSQPAAPEKTRVITKVITKTVNNTAEINKLKARIEELEQELGSEKQLTASLRAQLAEREGHLKDMDLTRRQLQDAYEETAKQAQQLRDQVEAMLDKQHEEQFKRAVAEISAGKDAVEMYLADLDSPMNLGNQEATAAMVMENAGIVSQVATRLVQVCEGMADESFNQGDLFSAVSAVSGALKSLFTDAKGASRLVDDQGVQQNFLESARRMGLQAAQLLEAVRAQGGQPQDEEERKVLQELLKNVLATVAGVVNAGKQVEEAQQKQQGAAVEAAAAAVDQSGIDLDDLAERELRAAAKTIEDAAKSLMAARAAKPPKNPTDTRPDVAEAILEAAMAITQATSTLVGSATSAQRERAERGRAIAATGAPYRRDPTWAEGLISAAKAVANATAALVGVANDAVQGKGESGEEGLIAVSKAVAAATSQLVAAARAKSDAQSPVQEKLSQAAKSVSHATSLLVAAARAASTKDAEEKEEDYTKLTATGYKVKEMEQTMQILRLEKELEKARKNLLTMRKSEYAK